MADDGNDTFIQDAECGPIDNCLSTGTGASHHVSETGSATGDPPATKRKCHGRKPTQSTEKRSKAQLGEDSTGQAHAAVAAGVSDAASNVPREEVCIPPEILNAIKRSLTGDLVQICQQTCLATMGSRSSSSSGFNSPIPPPPSKK